MTLRKPPQVVKAAIMLISFIFMQVFYICIYICISCIFQISMLLSRSYSNTASFNRAAMKKLSIHRIAKSERSNFRWGIAERRNTYKIVVLRARYAFCVLVCSSPTCCYGSRELRRHVVRAWSVTLVSHFDWRIEVFALCCADAGCIYAFCVYTGKENDPASSTQVVERLLALSTLS